VEVNEELQMVFETEVYYADGELFSCFLDTLGFGELFFVEAGAASIDGPVKYKTGEDNASYYNMTVSIRCEPCSIGHKDPVSQEMSLVR